jgi:hypothetical protein
LGLTLGVAAAACLWASASALAAPAPIAWCGNDVVAGDRQPDGVAGYQVQVVYAIPSDGADRFAALAPQIASDVNAIDDWWRRQDPARAPRFDLFPFPGCATKLGQLDLASVRLAEPASAFLAEDGRLNRLTAALQGLVSPSKKHLVYFDGPITLENACGTGWRGPPQEGGQFGFAAVWVQAARGCGTSLGIAGYKACSARSPTARRIRAPRTPAIRATRTTTSCTGARRRTARSTSSPSTSAATTTTATRAAGGTSRTPRSSAISTRRSSR